MIVWFGLVLWCVDYLLRAMLVCRFWLDCALLLMSDWLLLWQLLVLVLLAGYGCVVCGWLVVCLLVWCGWFNFDCGVCVACFCGLYKFLCRLLHTAGSCRFWV